MTAVAAPQNYERAPIREATLADLDADAIARFAARRAPHLAAELKTEALALRLGLATKMGSQLPPTVAGLYCFGQLPQLMRPEWGVSAVRVAGLVLSDPLAARVDLEGPIAALLDAAVRFVAEHTEALADQVDPAAKTSEYPEAAVREAICNALVHRDLRMSGRVAVHVFDDRLEVWSPGASPARRELALLSRLGGVSFPRNPLVAVAARTVGMCDQIGRGLPLIRRAVATATAGVARFDEAEADVRVTLPSALRRPPNGGRA